jgi:hypothetical protein
MCLLSFLRNVQYSATAPIQPTFMLGTLDSVLKLFLLLSSALILVISLSNGAFFKALHYYSLTLGVNLLLCHLKSLFHCDMRPLNIQTFKILVLVH